MRGVYVGAVRDEGRFNLLLRFIALLNVDSPVSRKIHDAPAPGPVYRHVSIYGSKHALLTLKRRNRRSGRRSLRAAVRRGRRAKKKKSRSSALDVSDPSKGFLGYFL